MNVLMPYVRKSEPIKLGDIRQGMTLTYNGYARMQIRKVLHTRYGKTHFTYSFTNLVTGEWDTKTRYVICPSAAVSVQVLS
jgi:hypothetical protein